MDLEQRKNRGEKAKRILEDEIVKDAFSKIEQNIIDKWREAKTTDFESQQHCKMMLTVFENFRAHFQAVINDGKIAEDKLSEKLKKPFKRR